MTDTRKTAEKIANTYGLTGNDLHKRTLADVIDEALRNERERCAKIAEDIMPIGSDDCYWCERVKRAVAAIRNDKGDKDGK